MGVSIALACTESLFVHFLAIIYSCRLRTFFISPFSSPFFFLPSSLFLLVFSFLGSPYVSRFGDGTLLCEIDLRDDRWDNSKLARRRLIPEV